jgi:tellurite resistance protein
MSIGARIKKVAKGLSAQQSADAFVRAREDPTSVSPALRNKADEFEATVEAMFLMAAVDGDLSPEELSQLAASIDAFSSIDGKPAAKIDTPRLLLAMNDKLGTDGWNARLAAVAKRLQDNEARAFAFRLAAGVAFVDDHVAHAEAAALEAMASALAISADDSQEILYDVREALFA